MKQKIQECAPAMNAVYGLGFFGAAVYFISHACGFWVGVLGFFKAIVWPAFIVYEILEHLGMRQMDYIAIILRYILIRLIFNHLEQ